jgi:hypothetical protein
MAFMKYCTGESPAYRVTDDHKEETAMRVRILIILLLTCSTVQASEWMSLGKTDDGTLESLVDVSSIRGTGNIRRAWVKRVFAHHTMRGVADDANKWQSYLVNRMAFNCSEESGRSESRSVYYDDGTVLHAPTTDFPWEPVPPDTMLSNEMRFICAWGKK